MKKKRDAKFYTYLAITLIALSFVPYGLILLVPSLSITTAQKAICVTILVVIGELIQWIAILIVGKQLFMKYKKYLNPFKWFKRPSSNVNKRKIK